MAILNNQRVMSMAGMIGYEVYPCHTIGPRPFMHTAWRARVWCAHLICSKLRCLPVVLFRKFSTALVLLCLVSMHSGFLWFCCLSFCRKAVTFFNTPVQYSKFNTFLSNRQTFTTHHAHAKKRADQVPQLQHHPRQSCRVSGGFLAVSKIPLILNLC